MTDIAERYIRLAHAIDAHSEGFIDGYGGRRSGRCGRPASRRR
ncbi:hypothetical protein ACFQDE_06745 [Deinococcus caeni]